MTDKSPPVPLVPGSPQIEPASVRVDPILPGFFSQGPEPSPSVIPFPGTPRQAPTAATGDEPTDAPGPRADPYKPGMPVTLTVGDRTVTGRIIEVGGEMIVDPGPPRYPGEPRFFGPYTDLTIEPDGGGPAFTANVSNLWQWVERSNRGEPG